MSCGAYRTYFHIGNIGFKFAKIDFYNANPFLVFLTGIIQNLLEFKRYRYYSLRKPIRQWNHLWQYKEEPLALCPVYFSFGIFNIVKHLPLSTLWLDLAMQNPTDKSDIDYWNDRTGYLLFDDIKPENFRKDCDGSLYAIDYGDFTIGCFNRSCVKLIDYR